MLGRPPYTISSIQPPEHSARFVTGFNNFGTIASVITKHWHIVWSDPTLGPHLSGAPKLCSEGPVHWRIWLHRVSPKNSLKKKMDIRGYFDNQVGIFQCRNKAVSPANTSHMVNLPSRIVLGMFILLDNLLLVWPSMSYMSWNVPATYSMWYKLYIPYVLELMKTVGPLLRRVRTSIVFLAISLHSMRRIIKFWLFWRLSIYPNGPSQTAKDLHCCVGERPCCFFKLKTLSAHGLNEDLDIHTVLEMDVFPFLFWSGVCLPNEGVNPWNM